MAYDLSEFKTPTFNNINNNPVAPTASKPGNGSDLIARVNGLVDAVQAGFNTLENATGATGYFEFITPPNDTNSKISIYYLNVSERSLFNSFNATASVDDQVVTFSGADYGASSTVNFSQAVQQCGQGYYFFVFHDVSGTPKPDSWQSSLTTQPLGVARRFEEYLTLQVYDNTGGAFTVQRIKPLVIQSTIGYCSVSLRDDEFSIG